MSNQINRKHLLHYPVEERMHLYNEAMKLRREFGYGSYKIANLLGINKNAVGGWLYNGIIPKKVHNYNNVDLSSSKELSYIVGAILGDGTLSPKCDYRISLCVIDKSFVDFFNVMTCKLLNRDKLYPVREIKSDFYKKEYCVSAFSKKLCLYLLDLKKNGYKNTTHQDWFLKGIVDAEGSILYYWKNNRLYKSILIANSQVSLINAIKDALDICKIHYTTYVHKKTISIAKDGHVIKTNHAVYYVAIRRKRDIRLFSSIIGFRISRKTKRLNELITELSKIGGYDENGKMRYPSSFGAKISKTKLDKSKIRLS